MRTTVSAKRCPECGKVTVLHAQDCAACGHQFRTRFAEPTDRTEAFDALLLPRPPAVPVHSFPLPRRQASASSFTQAFWGAFCLVAAVGLAVWLAWGWSQQAATPSSHAARPALRASGRAFSFTPPKGFSGPALTGGAEDLYGRISLAMSLYDVDQAAGGMGRLVRSADPHVCSCPMTLPIRQARGRACVSRCPAAI